VEKSVERDEGEKPNAEWLRQRRMRSIAIALVLLGLTAMFYAATIVRLGGNALNRPL
jgi:hypothetical protein